MINSVFLAAETLPVEYLDIVSKVNSFYNSAWIKLIWVIGTFFVILTILGPIFINKYQKRQAKLEQEKIEMNLKQYIDDKFEDIKSDLNEEMDKNYHHNMAMSMHIQGNLYLKDENKSDAYAINNFVSAAESYIKADDSRNLKTVLNLIYNYLKDENTTSKEINKVETYYDISIIDLINKVSKQMDDNMKILNDLRYIYKQKME